MMAEGQPMNRRLVLLLAPAVALGAALVAVGTAARAAAGDVVAAAKAAGQVGEMGDGFLGVVASSAPADVKAAVDEVNAGRAQAYKGIAAKTGVTEQAAAQAAAQALLARMPSGYYFKPLGGEWTRR
jgi:uncharacterized protein YdbL (DUF1318 family)